jgi:hypothetical protein
MGELLDLSSPDRSADVGYAGVRRGKERRWGGEGAEEGVAVEGMGKGMAGVEGGWRTERPAWTWMGKAGRRCGLGRVDERRS